MVLTRARAFGAMSGTHQANVLQCLETIMDWSVAVPEIKINSAQKGVRQGRMCALGYHASMEKDKSIVYYAPAASQGAFNMYILIICPCCLLNVLSRYKSIQATDLDNVALLYRDGLATLYPAGFRNLRDFAAE